jgi:hypothetical protein
VRLLMKWVNAGVMVRIPDALGRAFRRHLGTDSGRTWAAIPEHLGSRSGALGHGFRGTWAAVPKHLGTGA